MLGFTGIVDHTSLQDATATAGLANQDMGFWKMLEAPLTEALVVLTLATISVAASKWRHKQAKVRRAKAATKIVKPLHKIFQEQKSDSKDVATSPWDSSRECGRVRGGPPGTAKALRAPVTKAHSLESFAAPEGTKHRIGNCPLSRAVVAGRMWELPRLLDLAHERSVRSCGVDQEALLSRDTEDLLVVLRALAATHRSQHALHCYDHVADRVDKRSSALWSLLLFNAVAARDFNRGREIIEGLHATSPVLSGNDLVSVARCHARWRDAGGLKQLLQNHAEAGGYLDGLTRNRVLSAIVSEGMLDIAEAIAAEGDWKASMDAVTYNTLMKGHARAKRLQKCFALRKEMEVQGIQPTEVTYGTLLNACIGSKNLDEAKRVFKELCDSGLQVNAVHITTFVKGLVVGGRLTEAAEMLEEMHQMPGNEPDLIAYTTLVKAHSDRGNPAGALRALEQMLNHGIDGDEVIFNTVLVGCARKPTPPETVLAIASKLLQYGLTPSYKTLSIILNSLVWTGGRDRALQVLMTAPSNFGIQPELFLFEQLSKAFPAFPCTQS